MIKKSYLSSSTSIINIGDGIWTLTVTATVNGGTLPVGSDDSNLDMYYYISFEGIDALDAIVEE